MTTKELIRREIERRRAYQQEMYNKTKQDGRPNDGWAESLAIMGELEELRTFLDTLPDESEQPTKGYDEAYLNEKIAKASKSWEGVDADKFMDEVRGREPVTECNDFDSLFDEFCDTHPDGMTLEECGRFFFSRGFSRGKMVATNDFDLALAQRYLIGFNDGNREPVTDCNDLEEAKEGYLRKARSTPGHEWMTRDIEDAFKAGAEWAMVQGVKTTGKISPRGIIYDTNVGYHLFLERYHNGDKVEIQIRKIKENGK